MGLFHNYLPWESLFLLQSVTSKGAFREIVTRGVTGQVERG